MDLRGQTQQNGQHAAPDSVRVDVGTQQVVSLQEILSAGIQLNVTGNSSKRGWKDHAIDVLKTAGGVALGVGLAGGVYAVGVGVVGLFSNDDETASS